MKLGKNILPVAFFLAVLFPSAVFADILVLKSGKKLKVEKVWQEGDQICFVFHGVKADIPQSRVVRIEKESKHQNKNLPQPTNSSPAQSCGLRKDGFCDLQWEVDISSVHGLEKRQTISGLDNVVEYVRPKDVLEIGGATLTSIVYAFWRNQLYAVTIWTHGNSNYTALCDQVFQQFGKGRPSDESGDTYIWLDKTTDIMLQYDPASKYGMLWLRSTELDRKYRLSQLDSHRSLLKWMKSRN